MVTHPAFRKLLSHRNLKKELTEAMAAVELLEHAARRIQHDAAAAAATAAAAAAETAAAALLPPPLLRPPPVADSGGGAKLPSNPPLLDPLPLGDGSNAVVLDICCGKGFAALVLAVLESSAGGDWGILSGA